MNRNRKHFVVYLSFYVRWEYNEKQHLITGPKMKETVIRHCRLRLVYHLLFCDKLFQ